MAGHYPILGAAEDNDFFRSAQYLVTAIQKVEPNLAARTQELLKESTGHVATIPSSDVLMTWLINDVLDSGTAFVLVLDDYQTIQDKSVHKAMTVLLEQMPRNMPQKANG